MADIQYYGTGRRKTSTARVYLRPGDGTVQVNRKPFDAYFPNETLRMIIRQPLNLTETANKFDILVNVAGGGPAGTGRRDSSWHHARADRIQQRSAADLETGRSGHARSANQRTKEIRTEGRA